MRKYKEKCALRSRLRDLEQERDAILEVLKYIQEDCLTHRLYQIKNSINELKEKIYAL